MVKIICKILLRIFFFNTLQYIYFAFRPLLVDVYLMGAIKLCLIDLNYSYSSNSEVQNSSLQI